MSRAHFGFGIVFLVACHGSAKPPSPASVSTLVRTAERTTVPLAVEGNRPFVELTFRKADGTSRQARFVVDSGGGGFLMVEPLAKDLGLELGEPAKEEGMTFARVKSAVQASIDTVALELNPTRVLALVGQSNALPRGAPGHADGLLPGHVLARYHVVFDYPRGTFTIAKPGALTSEGTPLPLAVSQRSGFPRTEIEVDGKSYAMLLDTGASFTMVSQSVLEAWGKSHPEWERHPGAFGEAATLGGETLETMFVPKATWAGHPIVELGVVSQHTGVFEKWMSAMMSGPIVGSLAGNVLKQFRVDLDYPNEKLYVSAR